jgi:ADP-ribose pyrophosphatase
LSEPFRIARREPILDSYVFRVERRTVTNGADTFERDVVVHAGAVAVLAVRDDGAVGLLRQYRATFDDVNWELPAGTRDVEGEPPELTAARELEEELGCRPSELRELFRYMNSRGWTDQTTIVYLATGLEFIARAPSGPEEQHAEIHWLGTDELVELVDSGVLMESSTLMALMWHLARETR